MNLHSRHDTVPSQMPAGCFLLVFLVLGLSFPVTVSAVSPTRAASLSEMARLAASDEATIGDTRVLFQKYVSLGLLPEAASLLERQVRVGVLPAQAAVPLFEELVAEQSRFDDPRRLAALCETSIRSDVRTPVVLYHYGIALRDIPGRLGDASAALAHVGAEAPYQSLALYSLGQIAASRGDTGAALELFLRVERGAGGMAYGGFLARRAARARAELLLATGKRDEARNLFDALLRREEAPLDRIGASASGADPGRALEGLPPEMIAGMPLEDRVRFLLLLGGINRNGGRFDAALDGLDRAEREVEEALSRTSPPSLEPRRRYQRTESLQLQLYGLRTLRQELAFGTPPTAASRRDGAADLLVGLPTRRRRLPSP
jgi:tetratricopeptide (TPR) repeat protein